MTRYTDYQKRTIKRIVDNYFSTDTDIPVKRMLVADEVGLGKTYVAKGVIRALAYRYLCSIAEDKLDEDNTCEFKVMYLCSNLNIAKQNKSKLALNELIDDNIGDISAYIENDSMEFQYKEYTYENRSSMLYLNELRENVKAIPIDVLCQEYNAATGSNEVVDRTLEKRKIRVRVLPVTPATSIKFNNAGADKEREYILRLLKACYPNKMYNFNRSESTLIYNTYGEFFKRESANAEFKAKVDKFRKLLDDYIKNHTDVKAIIDNIQDLSIEKKNDEVYKYSKAAEEWENKWIALRTAFSMVSLNAATYNLVILDEFQNFGEILVEAENSAKSQAYKRKQRIFIYHVLNQIAVDKNSCRLMDGYSKIDGLLKEIKEDKGNIAARLHNINIRTNTSFKNKITDIIKQYESNIKGYKEDSLAEEETEIGKSIEDYIVNVYGQSDENAVACEDSKHYEIMCDVFCGRYVSACQKYIEAYVPGKAVYPIEDLDSKGEWLPHGYELELIAQGINTFTAENFYNILRNDNNSLWGSLKSVHPYIEIAYWLEGNECRVNELSQKRFIFINMYLLHLKMIQYKNKSQSQQEFLYLENKIVNYINGIDRYYHIRQNANIAISMQELRKELQNKQAVIDLLCLFGGAENRNTVRTYDNGERDILNKIFNDEINNVDYTSKILLLSATPFRMYMGREDITDNYQNNKNNSKETIKAVCDFLNQNGELTEKMNAYKNGLVAFSKGADTRLPEELRQVRDEFLEKMSKYFTRMEREAVLRQLIKYDNSVRMADVIKNGQRTVVETGSDGLYKISAKNEYSDKISEEELVSYDYKGLEDYTQELKKIMDYSNTGSVLSHAMRLPYALSFMSSDSDRNNSVSGGYKLKSDFNKKYKDTGTIPANIEYSLIKEELLLDETVCLGGFHGTYSEVLTKVLGDNPRTVADGNMCIKENVYGAELLLWIPPVVCRHQLTAPFDALSDYGKTIIFSAWTPVPRMLSVLISNEAVKRLKLRIKSKLKNDNESIKTQKELETELEILRDIKKKLMNYNPYRKNADSLEEAFEKVAAQIKTACNNCISDAAQDGLFGEDENSKEELKWMTYNFIRRIFLMNEGQVNSDKSDKSTDTANRDFYINGLMVLDALYRKPSDILSTDLVMEWMVRYCGQLHLRETLEEYIYMVLPCKDKEKIEKTDILWLFENTFGNVGRRNAKKSKEPKNFIKASKIGTTVVADGVIKECQVYTYFARGLGSSKDDDRVSALSNLQEAFNSPFAPFVFSTTSMGQEGLDFHYYADRIVHWNLPSNPVDFEQREGRINRRNCLAIRKYVVEKYSNTCTSGDTNKDRAITDMRAAKVKDILDNCFKAAAYDVLYDYRCNNGELPSEADLPSEAKEYYNNMPEVVRCGMIPHWLMPIRDDDGIIRDCVHIKRYVPYFGGSVVAQKYNRNLQILQLYRSVIGQPNPDELLDRLLCKDGTQENVQGLLDELCLDFSPYRK